MLYPPSPIYPVAQVIQKHLDTNLIDVREVPTPAMDAPASSTAPKYLGFSNQAPGQPMPLFHKSSIQALSM